MNRRFHIPLLAIFFLVGCQPAWIIEIISSSRTDEFKPQDFNSLLERFPKNEYCEGLHLEQILYENGIEVIDSVDILAKDGMTYNFPWLSSVESLCLNQNGALLTEVGTIEATKIFPNEIDLDPDHVHINNIMPIVLSALSLPHDNMPGEPLIDGIYEHIALIFLDGFGYEKLIYARDKGLIDFHQQANLILQAVAVYPPRTVTGTAAVITGWLPKDNGVDRGGIRKTDAETIFDITSENGISSAAIEGESLSFNLRNTEVTLSGDRDLNDGTDGNVFVNAMEVIAVSMPRLLWIHFHGIDDYGHTYGSDDPIIDEKIAEINGYIKQIFDALPEDTLVIYFADHGMHVVDEEGRLGNHGHLVYEDMVIPVIIKTK